MASLETKLVHIWPFVAEDMQRADESYLAKVLDSKSRHYLICFNNILCVTSRGGLYFIRSVERSLRPKKPSISIQWHKPSCSAIIFDAVLPQDCTTEFIVSKAPVTRAQKSLWARRRILWHIEPSCLQLYYSLRFGQSLGFFQSP